MSQTDLHESKCADEAYAQFNEYMLSVTGYTLETVPSDLAFAPAFALGAWKRALAVKCAEPELPTIHKAEGLCGDVEVITVEDALDYGRACAEAAMALPRSDAVERFDLFAIWYDGSQNPGHAAHRPGWVRHSGPSVFGDRDSAIRHLANQAEGYEVREVTLTIQPRSSANAGCAGNAIRPGFQSGVHDWMLRCFGPEITADTVERNHRFLEESLELVQACGCTPSEAHQLVDYVFGRPIGEKHQEVGGVCVTLDALCIAQGLDRQTCGEIELARINQPGLVEKIRAKQAAKPKHSPLPEHSSPAMSNASNSR